jgi:hypothetical protein
MGSAATSDKLRLQEIVAVLEPQFFFKKKVSKTLYGVTRLTTGPTVTGKDGQYKLPINHPENRTHEPI